MKKTLPLVCISLALFLMGTSLPSRAQDSPVLSGERVTLNFVNADMEATIRAVGSYTGKQFLLDPRVKGTLNLSSDTPLTRTQVLQALYANLRLAGFAAVEVGGVVRIVPEADAKLQGGGVNGQVGGDQLITQVFRLQNESAQNLVPVLRPLIAPNNTINAYPANNTLVITDYAVNLSRIARIIAAIDSPSQAEPEIIPVINGTAVDMAQAIARLTEVSTDPSQRVIALADPRTNSLVIRASTTSRLRQIKLLIAKLDAPTKGAGNLNVVSLKNAEAVKLAQTLQGMLGGSGSTTTGSGAISAAPLSSAAPVSSQTGPGGVSTGPSSNFGQSNVQSVTVTGANGVAITADPTTNSLIIRAPEPVYRELRGIIERLDVRRAQILVESLIVEVSADKAAEFGVQWLGISGNSDSKYRIGGASIASSRSEVAGDSSLPALIASKGAKIGAGLNIGIFKQLAGNLSLGALARALESDSTTNILSRPQIITLDNEEAKFTVGQNVPFITGQFTNTGASSGSAAVNPFQTIDRKDVGITLRVKPQVSEGGVVKLAIYQEVSSIAPTAASDIITNKRSLETNVLIDDGEILVLGGLIDDKVTGSVEAVPGLSKVPLLGGLFRYDNRKRTKTNLMVFLRPVVIRDSGKSNLLTGDRYEAIRAIQQNTVPADSAVLPNLPAPEMAPFPPPQMSSPPPSSFDQPQQ